eukprot:1513742-Rhodomonas_salina.1
MLACCVCASRPLRRVRREGGRKRLAPRPSAHPPSSPPSSRTSLLTHPHCCHTKRGDGAGEEGR